MTGPRRILEDLGLRAQKGRGQNFLADPRLAANIVARAQVAAGDLVLEIGPGLGALTRPLLDAGARVMAVEIDRGLVAYLEENIRPVYPDRLTILSQDILTVDLEALAAEAGGSFLVAGNLPYLISSPLLVKLVQTRAVITRAVLMFQKELADRLMAGPGTKAYGRLSVLLGYHARLVRLMDLPPAAFHPRPKVASTVLGLTFKPTLERPLNSEILFEKVVATAFGRRRKTLRNALSAGFSLNQVDAALAAAGIDPARRAEMLSVAEFADLANHLSSTSTSE